MKRLAVLAVLLVVAACGAGLDVDTYITQRGTTVDCKALYADAPRSVDEEDSILVHGDNAVAWGAPPIILRCGVEKPAALKRTSQCFPAGGVDWFAETTADGYLFTTIGRQFFISVEVPNAYDPESDALVDLAPTVQKHDPSVRPCAGLQ